MIVRAVVVLAVTSGLVARGEEETRPNIFIAISDDQSFPHASAYGSTMVETPHFDRVAREGVLFTHAFAPSPGCSPSRAAFLTGLNTWQLEHAGTHASYFDPKYETFPDRLAAAGYFAGHCGKGWGPGNFKELGRSHNPAAPRFNAGRGADSRSGYAGAFAMFLRERPSDRPFCFWFGSSDPHRGYEKGSGRAAGKRLEDAEVPPFLPDTAEIRSDLLDYAVEVERFDDDLGEMLALLADAGELDDTLVIVTSDNGMPFPRAKANCYEYGIHMPLAIRWGGRVPAGRVIDDLVGFTDLTATIYDVTGVEPPGRFPLVGRSLRALLESEASGLLDPARDAIYAARERHSSSRYNSLGYPQRCVRTRRYLYIRNFAPDRWPAGAAQKLAKVTYTSDGKIAASRLGPAHGGYHDIDASPTLTYLIEHRQEAAIGRFLELAVGKRPGIELYDVEKDPGCLENLAGRRKHAALEDDLRARLERYLRETGDPRVHGTGDVWETYPRVSGLRWFPVPVWAEGDPDAVPGQPWLEKRRPHASEP